MSSLIVIAEPLQVWGLNQQLTLDSASPKKKKKKKKFIRQIVDS